MPTSSGTQVNVLADPIFRVVSPGGIERTRSLPEILALLCQEDDPIASYPGLVVAQWSHWYRFLVRCMSKALRLMNASMEETGEWPSETLVERIREVLAESAGGMSAWDVVPATDEAAGFLQSPVSGAASATEAGYKSKPIANLTALIGSKEFERKSEAARDLPAAEVVYGLIEFQGGVIFGGRGNYETPLTPSRSGKGSGVPFMGLQLDGGSGATFRWDVQVLLDDWDRIVTKLGMRGSVWALWAEPWDGSDSMPASQLEPAFIPYARMVRISAPDANGRFSEFLFRASEASRVDDHTEGAVLGDPFTPFFQNPKSPDQVKVRGVMEHGFTYGEVAELLGFGERGTPSASVAAFLRQEQSVEVSGVSVLFEGVAFEQGKTLGFHRRRVPLPVEPGGGLTFADPDPFRRAHASMLEMLGEAKRVLRAASRVALHGEARPRKGDEAQAGLAADDLDRQAEADDTYLRFLFHAGRREAEAEEEWREEWLDWLERASRSAFDRTLPALPGPGSQRFARHMQALNYLDYRLAAFRADNTPTQTTEDAA